MTHTTDKSDAIRNVQSGLVMGNRLSSKNRYKFKVSETDGNNIGDPLVAGQVYRGAVAPFSIITGKLDQDLLLFLLEDEWLLKSDEEMLAIGFRKAVDNPELHNHHYYEGYFHGLKEHHCIESLNPRDGNNMEKPAAPIRIRAFIQATQEKNKVMLSKIASCFGENSTVRRLLESGNAFSDVAIQARYGSGIVGDHLQWHVDSYNSMLHMAVALQGVRTLHSKTMREGRKGATKHANIQVPGDVYLSSPSAFLHAVGHETVERKDRVVAMQCRILQTKEDNLDIQREYFKDPEKMTEAEQNIAMILKDENFLLPTFEEVRKILEIFDNFE